MIKFTLPEELIAQEPTRPRDHAKLLVYNRATQQIVDDHFYNLLSYLPGPTCVVANNSKVDMCRMLFDNARREIFVLDAVNDKTIRALVRPGKVFKLNKTVKLTDDVSCTVTAIDDEGVRTIEFTTPTNHPNLVAAQHVPLPPYIAQNDELATEYQTIYAKRNGSKAAPTAGLHFTDELKQKVQAERDWAEVTLHVGLGTFASLSDENFKTGTLHSELYEVDQGTYNKIHDAKHVTAVGTTSARTLESIFNQGRTLKGETDIFIQPGYSFARVDSLITNFHLPGTSLLLMVEAFIGSTAEMQRVYNHAIAHKYRFYSFGDAMLIL